MNTANKFSALAATVAILFVTLACLGPDGSSSRCTGELRSGGDTYIGKAKDKEQAGLNACNKFCLEKDKKFDGMYEDWLESEEGKSLAEKSDKKPSKNDAIMENKRLLDYVTLNCAPKCVKEAGDGGHELDVSCKE